MLTGKVFQYCRCLLLPRIPPLRTLPPPTLCLPLPCPLPLQVWLPSTRPERPCPRQPSTLQVWLRRTRPLLA